MNHGKTIVRLLSTVLQREEKELKTLAAQNPIRSLRSIHQFDESWLKYPLAKEAMRNKLELMVEFERGRVDVSFLDKHGRPLALFELKGPLEIRKRFPKIIKERIVEDFEKQFTRLQATKRRTEYYVVLLLHGRSEAVEAWLGTELLPSIRRRLLGLRLEAITSEPIPLNTTLPTGRVLRVVAYWLSLRENAGSGA